MTTRTPAKRLTTLMVIGLSTSLLVSGLLHAANLPTASSSNPSATSSAAAGKPTQTSGTELLHQASATLSQALADQQTGASTEAMQQIGKALEFLQTATQNNDPLIRDAATALLAEGQTLQASMAQESANHPSMLDRLGQRAKVWAERATSYADAKWAEVKGDGSLLRNNLIDARFHLQNARIEQAIAHDPAAARAELTNAQDKLGKAMQTADEYWTDPFYKQQVSGMQDTLKQLLPTSGDLDANQLDKLQQELNMIIHSL